MISSAGHSNQVKKLINPVNPLSYRGGVMHTAIMLPHPPNTTVITTGTNSMMGYREWYVATDRHSDERTPLPVHTEHSATYALS